MELQSSITGDNGEPRVLTTFHANQSCTLLLLLSIFPFVPPVHSLPLNSLLPSCARVIVRVTWPPLRVGSSEGMELTK